MTITREEQIAMAALGIQIVLAEAIVAAIKVSTEQDAEQRGRLRAKTDIRLAEAHRYYVALGRVLGMEVT